MLQAARGQKDKLVLTLVLVSILMFNICWKYGAEQSALGVQLET